MHARRLTLSYIFLISLSIGIAFISGLGVVPKFWAALLLYSIVLFIIRKLWRIIRPYPCNGFIDFFITFLYKSSLTLSLFLILGGFFVVYQNKILPVNLPRYTISNGEKTVIFQTMSHIASKSFYTSIENDISNRKKQGFVLFYEGVRPGSPKNTQDFNTALGINFSPDLYKNLSSLYGVVAQNNEDFLGLFNNKDYNIDLSLDDIINIYNKKREGKLGGTKRSIIDSPQFQDINSEIIHKLSRLSDRELMVLRMINQSILNFIIKHEGLRNILITSLGKEDLFSVILDDRNLNLSTEIIKSNNKNIYITYGLMHFKGVYKLLQQNDPRWNLIQTTQVQVIQN